MPYNTARKYYEGIQTRKDIYLYIIRYLKEHDYPPSIPEIAAGLSISNHTVQNHFGELLESGLLTVVQTANEYVKMANEGKMSVLSMMQDIEENTDVRFDEMNKNLVKKMGV